MKGCAVAGKNTSYITRLVIPPTRAQFFFSIFELGGITNYAEGNIEVVGKQNSLFSAGQVINGLLFNNYRV